MDSLLLYAPRYDVILPATGNTAAAPSPARPARKGPVLPADDAERIAQMLSFVLSTIAYFIASHYIKRYLDDSGVPKGFTRSVVIFLAAALIAYGVAFLVDWTGV